MTYIQPRPNARSLPHHGTPRNAGPPAARPPLLLAAVATLVATPAWAELITGPHILTPPPASVDDDPPCSACPPGRVNTFQEGFDELQGVALSGPLLVDSGLVIPIGTIVNSHMIFMNVDPALGIPQRDLDVLWEVDGPIIGVMSDRPGNLQALSDADLGLPTTCYPGPCADRGFEGGQDDGYTVLGNRIVVDTEVHNIGDWIRVVSALPAQGMTFSIDTGDPTVGLAGSFWGHTIDDGSILTVGAPVTFTLNPPTAAPGSPPAVMVQAPTLGLNLAARNVDALSYGHDIGRRLRFSVDEFATGNPAGGGPNVFTEGTAGNQEASADVFRYLGVLGPVPPPPPPPGNRALIDGNGLAPFGGPGVGLLEPNPPGSGQGDNLDAMDLRTQTADLAGPIFFSVDAATGAAYAPPLDPAAVLMLDTMGGTVSVYATPADLGLSQQEDDLDALAITEDGDGIYVAGNDQILFSVRNGSAVIGQLDSNLGMPITAGDVLAPPPGAGTPGIVVRHLWLGLSPNGQDELDALDRFCPEDVNEDRRVDFEDILAILGRWGPYTPCPPHILEDIDRSCDVDFGDILAVLAAYGNCS